MVFPMLLVSVLRVPDLDDNQSRRKLELLER